MTRLIFLTFYGNERFETGRTVEAVPVVSGGSDEGDAGDADDAVGTPTTTTPTDPSPTVEFGDPVPRRRTGTRRTRAR